MDKAKLIAFVKKNWQLVVMALLMVGTIGGVVKFQKGERFEIYIILPDEAPDVFGQPAAQSGRESPSPRAATALRMAGAKLREDDSDGSRKLFAVLQRLHNEPDRLADVEAAVKTTQLDPLTLTIIAKIALKIAIVYLERRAPRTESEWDDRLLALLKLFESTPATINAAHAAILKR